jgi:N6-adenosine-specific RNA methylase IME4
MERASLAVEGTELHVMSHLVLLEELDPSCSVRRETCKFVAKPFIERNLTASESSKAARRKRKRKIEHMDASPEALRLQALLVACVAQVATLCTGAFFGFCSNSDTSGCKVDEIDAVFRSWRELCHSVMGANTSSDQKALEAETISCDLQLFHRLVINSTASPIILRERFLVPCNSSFFMGCAFQVESLIGLKPFASGFNLIVMDPAWESKSVSRAKKYHTLSAHESLLRLPVPKLCQPGCVVAVWVTHNEKLVQFVKEVMLPQWGCRVECMWTWVKMSATGSPVFPIEDSVTNKGARKPYERLVVARFVGVPAAEGISSDGGSTGASSGGGSTGASSGGGSTGASSGGGSTGASSGGGSTGASSGGGSTGAGVRCNEDGRHDRHPQSSIPEKVLVSMPCRHSWKPPLETLFAPYLEMRRKAFAHEELQPPPQQQQQQGQQRQLLQDAHMLELFAREMRPGWTSVGDEVLKFQQLACFRRHGAPT